MPDSYTRLAKPTNADYVSTNAQGREQYDQGSLAYDDASTFWDGVDPSAYTLVAKPIDGRSIRAGMATGLLIPLTYSTSYNVGTAYTFISKPTN